MTTDPESLCARLEAKVDSGRRTIGGGRVSTDGGPHKSWGGEIIWMQRNPDGPEAAAMIRALVEERDRLEGLATDRLRILMAAVEESGGEIRIRLSSAVAIPLLTLHRHDDFSDGSLVLTTARAALSEETRGD